MAGKLIVIEGLDGSGKATQAQKLYEALKSKGENVMKVSFPDYESDSSALVKMYLNGEFGTDPNDVNPYAASSFYAVDRFASYIRDWKPFYPDGGRLLRESVGECVCGGGIRSIREIADDILGIIVQRKNGK